MFLWLPTSCQKCRNLVNGRLLPHRKVTLYSESFTILEMQAGTTNYAREYGASCMFNGEMMIFGGYNDRNGWTDIVEKKGGTIFK